MNLDHERDFKVEDVPIYTMAKDLENPSTSIAEERSSQILFKNPDKENKSVLSEKQKTSPFLEQSPVASPANSPTPPLATNLPRRSGNTETEITMASSNNPKTKWGKIIMIAVTIFVILISGAGGYYFWITKQETAIAPAETIESKAPPVEEKSNEPEEVQVPKVNNPSYFVLDAKTPDKTRLKSFSDKYFAEVVALKTSAPKEFITVDSNNNPVNFKDFMDSAGITFSPTLLLNLKDTFSLFLYNDSGSPKIGLAIDSKNDIELKSLMLKEESALAKELSPMFLLSDYTTGKSFAASNYGGAEIRYQNIISPEKLSIDYTIYKNRLMIGTTKLTLRAMIDLLNTEMTE